MISEAHIQNFKSVRDLRLPLGRITVLIGENGCGKSNVLEAIALAAAAAAMKLDNEFLASRGIRVTEPRFMRSAFDESSDAISLRIIDGQETEHHHELTARSDEITGWKDEYPLREILSRIRGLQQDSARSERVVRRVRSLLEKEGKSIKDLTTLLTEEQRAEQSPVPVPSNFINELVSGFVDELAGDLLARVSAVQSPFDFLIYSPENSSLRIFEREGQILPLGIKGEGLFKLLKTMSLPEHRARWDELREHLQLIDWYGDLRIAPDLAPFETTLQVRDRYLAEAFAYFDQRSANEGFLFLLCGAGSSCRRRSEISVSAPSRPPLPAERP